MLWFGRNKGDLASSTLICVSGGCLLNLLKFFGSHTYVLGAQKSCFSERVSVRGPTTCVVVW